MNNYVWDLDKNGWTDYVMSYENDLNNLLIDDCIGSCRIGELCFDILIRDYNSGIFCLTFDCYVGGIDSGYGYSHDGYPYDYADGGSFFYNDPCTWMSFEEFKAIAERRFDKFIEENELLVAKANEPLHMW